MPGYAEIALRPEGNYDKAITRTEPPHHLDHAGDKLTVHGNLELIRSVLMLNLL